jgi:diguanylate cyclase (GGDEF)-like protein/PAS domain S-box-containing protein
VHASDSFFRAAYEAAAVGMVMLNREGLILDVNRAMCEIAGYASADLVGKPLTILLSEEHQEDVARALAALGTGTKSYRADGRLVRGDRTSIWVRNSAIALENEGPAQLFVLVEDITEGKQAIEKLEYQAAHEEITGLYNRRYLEDGLTAAIQSAAASGGKAALLCLDLEDLKLVNDTLGHSTGDELLREVGAALARCTGGDDVLAHLGGGEFGIVRVGAGPDESAGLAMQILARFDTAFQLASHQLHTGASIGIATWPADGNSAGELLQNADAAMFSARKQGRNRYAGFTRDLRERAVARLEIDTQIRNGLASGEFHAEFQPIQETKDRKVTRFEAVCRWYNPQLGNVSPTQFIPIAEETGVILDLGQFMLRQACLAGVDWMRMGTPTGVSVNISRPEFAQGDFTESVWRVVEETNLHPNLLELEVNECVLGDDIDAAIDKVSRLRAMGIRVTLDNFGIGQSSLSYLRRIPVAALKIDRTFIADLQNGPGAVSLVRSIIGIANSFGLRTLADGVETDAQLRVLRFLGCQEVQGFYFGRPETLEVATARMREERTKTRIIRGTDSRKLDWLEPARPHRGDFDRTKKNGRRSEEDICRLT